jgi:cytochrome oxidase Cu insertion factor (SCO1/SenC/PrrC family)
MKMSRLLRLSLMFGVVVAASVAGTLAVLGPTERASAGTSRIGESDSENGAAHWGANYFPNAVLTDQFGRKHRFFDDLVKGKVVSINSFFTSCSASCGLETARMREVQKMLGDRVGKDVFFYSITIDPLTDTPEEMAKYAKRFDAGPGWLFLTGSMKDTELLRRKLGLYDDEDAANPNKNDHLLHSVIGNQATGRWMRASPFENPAITATQLGSWLHNYKGPSNAENRYELAPKLLRNISDGEKLYRTRCAVCHTVNPKDDSLAAMQKVGPDLEGVVKRRPRAWLERWLREPDKMLAEKDPVAVAMLKQYNGVQMPNLKLDPKQIAQVIEFIEEESALPPGDKRIKQ